jgi:hypothetical protein
LFFSKVKDERLADPLKSQLPSLAGCGIRFPKTGDPVEVA